MCSILGVLDLPTHEHLPSLRREVLAASARQRHRGPDWSGVAIHPRAILAHERLAIVDPASGAQPIVSADASLALAVNGEIYNHEALRDDIDPGYPWQTRSDCEVIAALYAQGGEAWLPRLNGIFAFVLHDRAADAWIIARDAFGVCPLYWGRDRRGRLWVASELKALADVCPTPEVFPPGHVFDSRSDTTPRPFLQPAWRDYEATRGVVPRVDRLRESLEAAVHRQLMCDVPYGVLLSGGLDSSIIAACAAQFARHRVESDDREEAWWPRLHSFSIGLRGAPDLAAAAEVAQALGTIHHGFEFTLEEGLDALPEVVRHIETFDVTTVRASTPMFLLARRIRAMGVKMVLSGEGADELFGGYLYFHKAPDGRAFHEETVRKLDALHLYDCLRANKAMAAWGVEARVPFLDPMFVEAAMGFDAEHKRVRSGTIEKQLLREAFADRLPASIAWRQKEQFSDGVGYGWIDALRAHAQAEVSDAELAAAPHAWAHATPATKEAVLYRRLFESHFPGEACARTVPGGPSIACSTPAALAWDAAFAAMADPSGRAVRGVHASALSG